MKEKQIEKISKQIELPKTEDIENKYPSIEIAYDLAVKAYELADKRLQVVEGRNEKLLGFILSINLALVAFIFSSNPTKPPFTKLFDIALILGGLALLLSLLVMLIGRIRVININVIYNKWLHLLKSQFQSEFIIKSATDFESNSKIIERKARATFLSAILFCIEVFLFVIWFITNQPGQCP